MSAHAQMIHDAITRDKPKRAPAKATDLPPRDRILCSLMDGAGLLSVSRAEFYKLRRREDFPKPVMLGPNLQRYRVDELISWERDLPAGEPEDHPEPSHLVPGRVKKQEERKAAAVKRAEEASSKPRANSRGKGAVLDFPAVIDRAGLPGASNA